MLRCGAGHGRPLSSSTSNTSLRTISTAAGTGITFRIEPNNIALLFICMGLGYMLSLFRTFMCISLGSLLRQLRAILYC